MMYKKGTLINPIDVVAGVVIIFAGVCTLFGWVNLGVVLGTIGFLIEAIKILMLSGP